jgi:hypothetical protein
LIRIARVPEFRDDFDMVFTSPLWLVGLLPWMAVTIWLFTGRRDRAHVPFLHLWKGPDATPPRARATIEVPPWAILCAILAMLLAILGAARPQLLFARNANQASPIPASQPSPSNIRIMTASASVSPKPQVMVRVRNDSDAVKASLKITSAGHEAAAAIDLPPRTQERNYFVDLDSVDATISVDLTSDASMHDRAMLSLAHSPPMCSGSSTRMENSGRPVRARRESSSRLIPLIHSSRRSFLLQPIFLKMQARLMSPIIPSMTTSIGLR